IRQHQQLLADVDAIVLIEIANAADRVAGAALLDPAVPDRRTPLRQRVEVADHGPDLFDRRIDDGTDEDFHLPGLPQREIRMSLNDWVWRVIAVSTGNRSMEDAP